MSYDIVIRDRDANIVSEYRNLSGSEAPANIMSDEDKERDKSLYITTLTNNSTGEEIYNSDKFGKGD